MSRTRFPLFFVSMIQFFSKLFHCFRSPSQHVPLTEEEEQQHLELMNKPAFSKLQAHQARITFVDVLVASDFSPNAPIHRAFTHHYIFDKNVTRIIFEYIGHSIRPLDQEGIRYYVNQYYQDAMKTFKHSANHDNIISSYMYMGIIHGFSLENIRDGRSEPRPTTPFAFQKAEAFWKMGASRGDAGCLYWLAQGQLSNGNPAEALKLLKRSIKKNYMESIYLYAVLLLQSIPLSEDISNHDEMMIRIQKMLQTASDSGHYSSTVLLKRMKEMTREEIMDLDVRRTPNA